MPPSDDAGPRYRARRHVRGSVITYTIEGFGGLVSGSGPSEAAARAALLESLAAFSETRWPALRTRGDSLAQEVGELRRRTGQRLSTSRLVDFGGPA